MYKAIIAKINKVEPIIMPSWEEATNVQKWEILGSTVVISKDYKVWDVGIYFWVDGQLSRDFAIRNNLVRKKDWNWKNVWGFLEENRRIKCLKLLWVRSDGLFLPLSSLHYESIDETSLKVWDVIDETSGICNKYVSPQTRRAMSSRPSWKSKRWETLMFKKHFDTEQLMYYIDTINKWDTLIITNKLHGTSHRVWYVLDEVKQNWLQRLLKMKPKQQWQFMSGTRNVITTDTNRDSGFHDWTMRTVVDKMFEWKLHKWEQVYCEIVWYEPSGTPIMGAVSNSQLEPEEKELYKHNVWASNNQIVYTYWCDKWELDVYVYRISITNEDGHSVDYSWNDVMRRCDEMWVKYTPQLMTIYNYDWDSNALKDLIKSKYESQPDMIDNSHPMEWICVRVEWWLKPRIFKYKNYVFKLLEWIIKSSDSYIDTEESS